MTVYIVENGERCEGGSVVGIFQTWKSAVDAALACKTHFPGGWVGDEGYWTNGCDYVKIETHEVKE